MVVRSIETSGWVFSYWAMSELSASFVDGRSP
jgi:hypothetical protein